MARFNEFARTGVDIDFHRGEQNIERHYSPALRDGLGEPDDGAVRRHRPLPLHHPRAAAFDTCGGPVINTRSQVVDTARRADPRALRRRQLRRLARRPGLLVRRHHARQRARVRVHRRSFDGRWLTTDRSEGPAVRTLDFALADADNHYYETADAFTRHLPDPHSRLFEWAEIRGRRRLVVNGRVNSFIPNPTFDPIGKPGALSDYFLGKEGAGRGVHGAVARRRAARGPPGVRAAATPGWRRWTRWGSSGPGCCPRWPSGCSWR